MQAHTLHIQAKPGRKRVGRGGKRGTYAGRGNKGQKARSGAKVNPLFEGGRSSLVERLKKVRGFKSPHAKKINLTLTQLDRFFADGDTVSLSALAAFRILDIGKGRGVKVLGTGRLTKKLRLAPEILVSASARQAVEQAGGTVEHQGK